ncbi:MAG: mechanosensitive ion channel [Alphaproteobacteria bacterium]|nr:mechanosensitive ion channel [Alphaproteobacteria bacterium]
MELEAFLKDLVAFLPTTVAALAVLIVGWIIAVSASGVTRAGLRRSGLSARIAKLVSSAEVPDTECAERWAGRAVFWLIILFTLVGFFQILGLSGVSGPLTGFLNEIFTYAPRLIGPAILLAVAWVVAVILRVLVRRGLGAINFDERVKAEAGVAEAPALSTSETIATAVYWLTFLVFLPAILGGLQLGGLLDPVKELVRELLGYLPNLFGAVLILVVGWFVAHVVRTLLVNFLSALGVDRIPEKVGLQAEMKEQQLSGLIGLIAFALILIPIIVAALQALELDAVTEPASAMLGSFLDAIPAIIGAAVLLTITYFVARLLAALTTSFLESVGFNELAGRLGLGGLSIGEKTSPAQVVGYLVLVGIMLFAAIEAFRLMGFDSVAQMAGTFLAFAGDVVLGLFIIGLGLFIGKLVGDAIAGSSVAQAALLARVGRLAVVVLAFAMGLQQMGIADEIIMIAFGICLGAIGVAAAIAFGLGSRDAAKDLVEKWTANRDQ